MTTTTPFIDSIPAASLTSSATETFAMRHEQGVLHVTLNDQTPGNTMSLAMVEELTTLFSALSTDAGRRIRVVVIRGARGQFCSGAEPRDLGTLLGGRCHEPGSPTDSAVIANRSYGAMLQAVDQAPQAVVVAVEGVVTGGGYGLACAADITIATRSAEFRMAETTFGIPPAQIIPFVVARIGRSWTRQMAVTGACVDGARAAELGLVHQCVEDGEALTDAIADAIAQIRRCEPIAVATAKALAHDVTHCDVDEVLDRGARAFAVALRGPAGQEGIAAFMGQRPPEWARTDA